MVDPMTAFFPDKTSDGFICMFTGDENIYSCFHFFLNLIAEIYFAKLCMTGMLDSPCSKTCTKYCCYLSLRRYFC